MGHPSCLDHQAREPGQLPKTAKSVFIEPDKRLMEEHGPGRCHHWSHVRIARAESRQGPSPRCPGCSTTIPGESLSLGTTPSSSSPSIPQSSKGRIGGKLFLLFLFNFSALLFFFPGSPDLMAAIVLWFSAAKGSPPVAVKIPPFPQLSSMLIFGLSLGIHFPSPT